jgi:predicted Rossmann-fold nucleotide-binding protein
VKPRRGVCVFCGSCPGTSPVYAAAARELGTLLADAKLDVVYGGSSDGCMGVLADAALAERKLRMLSFSVGAIVLPGGTGTLDEFLEVLTMKRMAMVQHPLIVVDVEGFFGPLEALLTHLIATGFMSEAQRSLYSLVEDPAAALGVLEESL